MPAPNKQYKTMGFNWLHKHRAPHYICVSVDSDAARNPHRFILQHVRHNLKNMRLTLTLIFSIGFFINVVGQNTNDLPDSLVLINIHRTYKINILKRYKNTITTPAISMDFPYSNYDLSSKTLRLLRSDRDFRINDSTFSIVRVADMVDESYGSGGSDELIQIKRPNQRVNVDSNLVVDSISTSGIAYLIANDKRIILTRNNKHSFSTHRQEKTKEALLDLETIYFIENIGNIVVISSED